jgi:hypothetical protein
MHVGSLCLALPQCALSISSLVCLSHTLLVNMGHSDSDAELVEVS